MNVPWIRRLAIALLALLVAPAGVPPPARAALSERGGSGVFEVQSAESKRPGRLELGIFGSAQRLSLQDVGGSRVNALTGGVNLGLGLPGGFEVSGTVPAYGYYLTTGSGGLNLNDNIAVRLGDVAARMRWTHGFLMPGMRWGFEGEASFPTGNDRVESYPGRTPSQPFTLGENTYTGRAMLTWDGLRAGGSVALRLHANGAYTVVRDESRFVLPRGPLPLELGVPARKGDNDVLSLGAAVELDLARLTLFTEAVTDQFVNERGLLAGRENRMALTPGVRFWIPGGLNIAAAYSMDISKDDTRTAFDPRREFPDHEWRVAVSLGTIYRGSRARAEDAAALTDAPTPAPAPVALGPAPAPVLEPAIAADAPQAKRELAKQQILERRPTQETPPPAKPEKVTGEMPAATAVPVGPPGLVGAVRPAAPARLADTDGDGIPDAQDQCPLMAEDWDGFQDLDGCPDLDNDGDGIPDIRDACPNDPETYNGYYDFDGCPDGAGVKWVAPENRSQGPTGAVQDSGRGMPPTAAARPAGGSQVAPTPTPPATAVRVVAPAETLSRPAPTRTPEARPQATVTWATTAREDSLVAALAAERARLSSARADSLSAALQVERRRADELTARLERTDAERRELLGRVMAATDTTVHVTAPAPPIAPVFQSPVAAEPVRPAPAPAPVAAATPAAPSRADSEAMTALNARLERLERMTPAAAPGTTAPGGATVVNVPRTADGGTTIVRGDRDVAARVAALERELNELKHAAQSTAPATPPPAVAPPEVPNPLAQQVETIESRLDSMSTIPPEAPRPPVLDTLLPGGVTRAFREVRFETGSAYLTSDAIVFLSRLAALLAAEPDNVLRITGHTDDVGLVENNLRLSHERAATVARLLEAQGVPSDRLIVEGRGEAEPVASNATAAGREANRRVTFTRIR